MSGAMSKLSPKQQHIDGYILDFAQDHGYRPSVREISPASRRLRR